MNHEALLRTLYDAFNVRQIESVLAALSAEVDWPNAWEGGRLHGHDEVRDYWTRQWQAIDPTVDPIAFTTRPDGSIAVRVHQVVHDRDGVLISEGDVVHVYRFEDDVVVRMDVEEQPV
jgi:nuclear transport factor 2 (NTF2) superfamily protein